MSTFFEPPSDNALLLICGNRALAESPEAKKLVWQHMLATLRSMPQHTLILHGDCEGSPDVWAKHASARLAVPPTPGVDGIAGPPWVGYQLATGQRITSEGKTQPWTRRRGGWSHLDRNFAMVLRAQAALCDGWAVHIVGYLAEWTRTHGAQETLEMAESIGLDVERVVIKATSDLGQGSSSRAPRPAATETPEAAPEAPPASASRPSTPTQPPPEAPAPDAAPESHRPAVGHEDPPSAPL